MPYAIDELFAAEVVTGLAFFGDFTFDHVLRGDTGMVSAGHPERIEALHPARADDHVLKGDVEGMTDM